MEDRNYSESKGLGVNTNLGTSTNKGKTNLAPSGSTTLSFNNTASKQKQETKATMGQGNITVGGVLNPELAGLNRDISNSQEITYDKIERGLDGSVTVDNRLLIGFLKTEVKDKEGNAVYERDEQGNVRLDSDGNPKVMTVSGYQSLANDFTNFGGNFAKASLGVIGTVMSTGKTLYDVVTNKKISITETADAWQANQKTFVNQNNYDREVINNLSEGQSVEDIEKAAGGTVKMYHDENDSDAGFREKGDKDTTNNYLNAAHGTATDTDKFVQAAAHEYAHNYSSNEAIAESAGKLAGLMWGLGNALNLTSVNTNGTATSTSWYQANQNSSLLQSNTSMANSIAHYNRDSFAPALILGVGALLYMGMTAIVGTNTGKQFGNEIIEYMSGLGDNLIGTSSFARVTNNDVKLIGSGEYAKAGETSPGDPNQFDPDMKYQADNSKNDDKQKEESKNSKENNVGFLQNLRDKIASRKVDVDKINANPKDEFTNPKIGPSDTQYRYHVDYIRRTGKIEEPITVRRLSNGNFEIVDGHHRWQAAKNMGLKEIPVKVVK